MTIRGSTLERTAAAQSAAVASGAAGPVEQPANRAGYAWYVTFVLTLCYTVAFLDSKLPFILVEAIKADLGLTDTQFGIIAGPAFSLTYALSVVPIARLSDRLARKYVLAAAISVWSAFTAAGGLAQSFIPLLLSRIGIAIGEGALTPAAHSMIADMFPEAGRAKAIAVYSCGISIGAFLALVAGGLINDHYGWRTAMFLVGACGVVLTTLMIFTVREPRRAVSGEARDTRASRETVQSLLADPVIRHTIAGGTLVCMAHGAASAWFPAYVIRTFSLSASQVGVTFGATGGVLALIGTLFGGMFSGWLSRNDPRRGFSFLAVAFAVAAALKVTALAMPGYPAFLLFMSVATFLLMFYPGPTYAMIQSRVTSGSRSFASAVALFCLHGIGIAFGAFITGWLSDHLFAGDGAQSLRWALGAVSLTSAWAGLHYLAASRHLPRAK